MSRACCCARSQASIQAFLRPGVWIPGLRNLHRVKEEWSMEGDANECMEALTAAVESMQDKENLEVHKSDSAKHFVEIFSYTPRCNWLDVVDITFTEKEGQYRVIWRILNCSTHALTLRSNHCHGRLVLFWRTSGMLSTGFRLELFVVLGTVL